MYIGRKLIENIRPGLSLSDSDIVIAGNDGISKDSNIILPDSSTTGDPLLQEYLRTIQSAKGTFELNALAVDVIVPNGNETIQLAIKNRRESSTDFSPLFDAIINKIENDPDKKNALIFFKHLSTSEQGNALLRTDREYYEGDVLQYLDKFDASKAITDVNNLTKVLIANCKRPELPIESRNSTLKLLYHGFTYIRGIDWSRNIDDLKDLLNSNDATIRLFTEQSLKVLEPYINSSDQAREMLSHLQAHNRLAGDLAQILFIKFPELKTEHRSDELSADLKSKSTREICSEIEILSNRAMNQADTSFNYTGNVGIELELKLRGSEQARSQGDSIVTDIFENDDIKSLVSLGKDGRYDVAEIRSHDFGFALNSQSRAILFKLGSKLQASEDLCRFLTVHINIDTPSKTRLTKLLRFRKDEGRYWENIACPVPLSKLPSITQFTGSGSRIKSSSINDGYIPYALDISAVLDQLTINDFFKTEASLNKNDLVELTNILADEKLGNLYKNSFTNNDTQRITAKVLIHLAKKLGREEVIPPILRLYQSRSLPKFVDNSIVIIGFALSKINPSTSFVRLLEDKGVQNFLADKAIDSANKIAFLERLCPSPRSQAIEDLIQNREIDLKVREAIKANIDPFQDSYT